MNMQEKSGVVPDFRKERCQLLSAAFLLFYKIMERRPSLSDELRLPEGYLVPKRDIFCRL